MKKISDYLLSRLNKLSLRFKMMGMIVGIVILFSFIITLEMQQTLTNNLSKQLEQRGISIARDVAARSTNYILINNTYAVHELLRDTLTNNQDIRYGFVLDANGNILAHTFDKGFPKDLKGANQLPTGKSYHTEQLDTEEGNIHDIVVPILEGHAGAVRIGVTDISLKKAVRDMTWQLILTTIVISILGILGAFLLTRFLTLPIIRLVKAAEAVGKGDLKQKVPPSSEDEIGQLSRSFNDMMESLEKYNNERDLMLIQLREKETTRVQLLEKVISAQEDERKRIARELHDETSQSLTSVMVGLRVLESNITNEKDKTQLREMRSVVSNALDEVRRLARQLRPSVLDDLGLIPALQRYIADYSRKYTIEVDLHVSGFEENRLDAQIETTVYRIIQEALTNVARYAKAENVSVVIERRTNLLVALVEDDGVGFKVEDVLQTPGREVGLGLFGMKERAALIGGTLVIESDLGTGTTVYLKVPLVRGENSE